MTIKEMKIKEELQKREDNLLAEYAFQSSNARRNKRIGKDFVRLEFQRDIDRIVFCKSFQRLRYKAQVFSGHGRDHLYTRSSHVMAVNRVAIAIARVLHLNEDLVSATLCVNNSWTLSPI